jgi:hypothetical protein
MRPLTAASLLLLVGLAAEVAACGGDSASDRSSAAPAPGSAAAGSPSAPDGSGATPVGQPGAAAEGCTAGDAVGTGIARRHACVANATGGGHWTDETCAAGSGCFSGICTPSRCSDECTLGETSAGKTCALLDIATGSPAASDPQGKTHDRARGYLARLRRESLASGGVGSAHYSDATLTTIASMEGIGDSALWTGTLLASEALRLRATGSADARARVRMLTETMHLWLNVAGEPGMLVRWAKESGMTLPFAIGDLDCAAERVHCGVDHGGKKYDFVGHISRDQYQGVMLGLALAYDALGSADADLREHVRADVVTIVEELMKERTLPLTVTLNGGIPLTSMVTARFMVVSPREMKNGALDLRLDLAKPNDSDMFGFQEFYPNLAQLVRQLPGLGWVPDVNRASSAIMLASFFRVGLKVTEGVPAYAKRRADMLAYYTGHAGEGGSVTDWLAVAKQWTDSGSCGSGYFANNISVMPMYDLARLEDDPARAAAIQNDILGARMWPAFASTKNSFFSFIYAGTRSGVDAAVVTSAAAQLAQYPAAPRVMAAVDLRSSTKYPTRQQGCTDQVGHADAVDVGDRQTADFLWQRHPWALFDAGDPSQTEPGVDYLVAYFMGRQHCFIADDTPGTCLAWQ